MARLGTLSDCRFRSVSRVREVLQDKPEKGHYVILLIKLFVEVNMLALSQNLKSLIPS